MPRGVYERSKRYKEKVKTHLDTIRSVLKRCNKCGRLYNNTHVCPSNYDWLWTNKSKAKRIATFRKHFDDGKIKSTKFWLNRKRSMETKRKISETKKGQYATGEVEPYQKKDMILNTGKTWFKKGVYAGEKHHNWKGGITPLKKRMWCSSEYQKWRKMVFERDDYTCQNCDNRGGKLNAHHIKPIYKYPELVFDVSNGVTLCEECHLKYHKKYGFRGD